MTKESITVIKSIIQKGFRNSLRFPLIVYDDDELSTTYNIPFAVMGVAELIIDSLNRKERWGVGHPTIIASLQMVLSSLGEDAGAALPTYVFNAFAGLFRQVKDGLAKKPSVMEYVWFLTVVDGFFSFMTTEHKPNRVALLTMACLLNEVPKSRAAANAWPWALNAIKNNVSKTNIKRLEMTDETEKATAITKLFQVGFSLWRYWSYYYVGWDWWYRDVW